jgi:hypothetical protein
MQMALAVHRRKSSFAPTVAEIIAQIEGMHMGAIMDYLSAKSVDDKETMLKSKYLMEATKPIAVSAKREIDYSYLDDIKLLGGFEEFD